MIKKINNKFINLNTDKINSKYLFYYNYYNFSEKSRSHGY